MIQIIHGECPSKSNCYKITHIAGHASLGKTPKLNAYEKSFYLQCGVYRNKNIGGLFELHLKVFNGSNRSDLDNKLKIILDCLQSCKAIKNDRQCIKIVAEKFVDKISPRIEFKIVEV